MFKSSAFHVDLSETDLLISTAEVIAGHPQVSVTIIWDNSPPPSFLYCFGLMGEVPERNSMLMWIYINGIFPSKSECLRDNVHHLWHSSGDFQQLSVLLREQLRSQITRVSTLWLTGCMISRYKGVLLSLTLSITKVRLLTAPPLLGC